MTYRQRASVESAYVATERSSGSTLSGVVACMGIFACDRISMKNGGDSEGSNAAEMTWCEEWQFRIELLGDGRRDPWWPTRDESDSAFPGGATRKLGEFGRTDDDGGRLLPSDQSQDDGGSSRLAAASATGAANDPRIDDSVDKSVRDGANRQDSRLLPWRVANWHM